MHFRILAHRGYLEVPNNRLIESLACFFLLVCTHHGPSLGEKGYASVRM